MSIWKEKKLGTVFTIVLAAGPVMAGGPAPGCFERDYSMTHLARNPAQVVDRILFQIVTEGAETVGWMWVTTARQGHVQAEGFGGQRFTQFLVCWSEPDGRQLCGVECDGGTLTITKRESTSLTFETDYLMVGDADECGGAVDLAEVPGQMVSYRLDAVPASVCYGEY